MTDQTAEAVGKPEVEHLIERLRVWPAKHNGEPGDTFSSAFVGQLAGRAADVLTLLLADRERLRLALASLQGYRGRLDRKKLRRIFDQWNREEIESIELIEAVGAFLGAEPLALLPPAPDGATEGEDRWIVHLERRREDGGLLVWSSTHPGLILAGVDAEAVAASIWPALRALDAYHPSVSPVGPKGRGWIASYDERADVMYIAQREEPAWRASEGTATVVRRFTSDGALIGVTILDFSEIAPSQPTQTGEEPSTRLSAEGMATLRRISEDDSPPNEALKALMATPSQTGEENAGLVDEARTAALVYRTTEVHGYAKAADLIDRLADKLASRSPIPGGALQNQLTRNPGELAATNPIPGELKALSDAATDELVELKAGLFRRAIDCTKLAITATGDDLERLLGKAAAYEHGGYLATEAITRQALAKTHQVAEGGVASAADSA